MSLIKVRKIATLDGEDKRDGKDSIAADAMAANARTARNSSYSLDDLEKLNGYARLGVELVGKLRGDIHAAYRTNEHADAPKDVMDWLYKIEGSFRDARNSGMSLYRRLYNAR
jgi:hypothetical protein